MVDYGIFVEHAANALLYFESRHSELLILLLKSNITSIILLPFLPKLPNYVFGEQGRLAAVKWQTGRKPADKLSDVEDSEYEDWEGNEFEDPEIVVEDMPSDQKTFFKRRLHS